MPKSAEQDQGITLFTWRNQAARVCTVEKESGDVGGMKCLWDMGRGEFPL